MSFSILIKTLFLGSLFYLQALVVSFCVFVALTALLNRESTLLTLSQQVVEVTEFGTTTFSSSLAQLRIIRCDSPAKENCVSNFDQSVRVKWIAIISIYRSSFRYLSIYRIGAFCQVLRNLWTVNAGLHLARMFYHQQGHFWWTCPDKGYNKSELFSAVDGILRKAWRPTKEESLQPPFWLTKALSSPFRQKEEVALNREDFFSVPGTNEPMNDLESDWFNLDPVMAPVVTTY